VSRSSISHVAINPLDIIERGKLVVQLAEIVIGHGSAIGTQRRFLRAGALDETR
jgi:hypothetical protein